MKRLHTIGSGLLFATIFLTGCATSSHSPEGTSTTAAPAAGHGRITFYRPGGLFGYAQRAEILLDGAKVGKSAPGVKFSVDATPGVHQVTVPNVLYSGEHAVSVTVRKNETTYVRTSLGGTAFGGRTNVEVVSPSQGAQETADLKFVNY